MTLNRPHGTGVLAKAPLLSAALLGIQLSGCAGYPSPGGFGYMGTGGMYGMGGLGMGAMGMPMAMGTSGYGMGSGYIGTEYGTGGMDLGTNLGGWGDGLGNEWGQSQDRPQNASNDGNPHLTSSYHNTDFDNSRGYNYYHPAIEANAPPR